MNKIILFFILIIFTTAASFNKNSKFWTPSKNISEEKNQSYKEISIEDEALEKELNPNLTIKFKENINNNLMARNYYNNDGRFSYNGILKKSSRYKFSKIKNFYQFEPSIALNNKNIIFFDNKGSILQFDDKSKLFWKKNYYSK